MNIYVIVFEQVNGKKQSQYIGLHKNIDRAYTKCGELGLLDRKNWKWVTSSEFSLFVWLTAWIPFTAFIQTDWKRETIAKTLKK